MSYEGLTEEQYIDLLDQRGDQIKYLKSIIKSNQYWSEREIADLELKLKVAQKKPILAHEVARAGNL